MGACTPRKSYSLWTNSIIRYMDRETVRTSDRSLKNSLQKYFVSTLNWSLLRQIVRYYSGISFLDRITPRSAEQAWINRNLFLSHKQDLIVIIL